MIDFTDKLRAFVGKPKNWRCKIEAGNTATLEHTTGVDKMCTEKMRHLISQQLSARQIDFEIHFLDMDTDMAGIVQDPFDRQQRRYPMTKTRWRLNM